MIKTGVMAGLGLLLLSAVPAAADAKMFPYPAKANYCPSGLQPIVLNGVICCGVPNQETTYSSYMAHPTRQRAYTPRVNYGSKSPSGWDGSKSPNY